MAARRRASVSVKKKGVARHSSEPRRIRTGPYTRERNKEKEKERKEKGEREMASASRRCQVCRQLPMRWVRNEQVPRVWDWWPGPGESDHAGCGKSQVWTSGFLFAANNRLKLTIQQKLSFMVQ